MSEESLKRLEEIAREELGESDPIFYYTAKLVATRFAAEQVAETEARLRGGARLIAEERTRQIAGEGWSPEHDDQHTDGALAVAAAVLAVDGTDASVVDPLGRGSADDPWGLAKKHGYRSGGDPARKLAIAGALIAAEIDRLERRHPDAGKEGA